MPSDEKPQPPRTDEKAQSRIESTLQAAKQQVEVAENKLKSAIQATRQQVEVDAVELKTIEIRLTGVKEAAQRSRFVFLIMTIAAAAILITLWDSYVSWNLGHASEVRAANVESRAARNEDELISEWIKGRTISVGLLGIRVGVEDLAVIGSISLTVIMMWYFFSQRRENRAIVSLLRDCIEGLKNWQLDKYVCSMVYQAIVHSLVFIDIGKGDAPLKGLVGEAQEDKSSRLIRWLLTVLVYLPPITISTIVALDIYTLFTSSVFRTSEDPLWTIVVKKGGWTEAQVLGFELFAVLAVIYTGILCRRSRKFSIATAETLAHFEAVIKDPDEFLKDPDGFLNDRRREKS
jgi:hypothetical protein